jgi:hypothetical protein
MAVHGVDDAPPPILLVGVALVPASSPRFTAEEASLPAAQRAAPRRRPATSRGDALEAVRQRVVSKSYWAGVDLVLWGRVPTQRLQAPQRQLPRCKGALVGVDASRSWRGAPRRRRSCRRLSPPCGHRVPSRWPPRRQPPGCRRSCCRCRGSPPAPQLRHAPSVVSCLQLVLAGLRLMDFSMFSARANVLRISICSKSP